ncbi:hypothetical protein DFH07DRAFT_730119 [Mycena maculata]|uniref:SMP-30/Gluconolactonase/LRE-like region domain-containing protein n=1 Tax=Mycena maculata TaxID=230809 RepID=A0AAD7NYC9_9AGAR|nr:hypothetical protein DFH07DRAFT_730119 [Mycena maculata]
MFLENIAVRPNSKLLLTSVLSPTLYTLDPTAANATLSKVYTFPNCSGLAGISEYQPDVYVIIVSTNNLTTDSALPGTVSVWRLNLTSTSPIVKCVVFVPNSTLLNRLSTVPGLPHTVLAADSHLGAAYEIAMSTRGVAPHVAIQDAAMAPPPAIRINGLHVHNGQLYFTNSQQGPFAWVPLCIQDGLVTQAGAVQILGSIEPAGAAVGHEFDNFPFDRGGRAWIAAHPGALTLFYPLPKGTWVQQNAAGDPEGGTVTGVFNGPTSAAFGRGSIGEEEMLYVTTEGGQVVHVDTSGAYV